jgi:hypothetical protein
MQQHFSLTGPQGLKILNENMSSLEFAKLYAESSGYLYHYAPREARESLLKYGFNAEKKINFQYGVQQELKDRAFFYSHPYHTQASHDLWGSTFGSEFRSNEMDLYRIKVNSNMIADMKIDPNIDFRKGETIANLKSGLEIGEITDLNLKVYDDLLGMAEQADRFGLSKLTLPSAITTSQKSVEGIIPELFFPSIGIEEDVRGFESISVNEGNKGIIKNLKGRMLGTIGVDIGEERGYRPRQYAKKSFSQEDIKIMGQVSKNIEESIEKHGVAKAQRAVKPIVRAGGTGVMSPGTLSNVIQSTENALKVMRGIL